MIDFNAKLKFQKLLIILLRKSKNLPEDLLNYSSYNNPNTLNEYQITKNKLYQLINLQDKNENLSHACEMINFFFQMMPNSLVSSKPRIARDSAAKHFKYLMKNYEPNRNIVLFNHFKFLENFLTKNNIEYQWTYIERFNELTHENALPKITFQYLEELMEQTSANASNTREETTNSSQQQWVFKNRIFTDAAEKEAYDSTEPESLHFKPYTSKYFRTVQSSNAKDLAFKAYSPTYFDNKKRQSKHNEISLKKMKIDFLCDPILPESTLNLS